ncbi:alanine racemase [bacterium]|nr:alanine racemase [bacterium]
MRGTVAEIDLKTFRHNLQSVIKKVAPAKVMAVVKANAYGHGAIPLAYQAVKGGADYLAVAVIEEAIELRQGGITAPILVLGGESDLQLQDALDYNLEITVYTMTIAEQLSEMARKMGRSVRVHIKVDTGMSRVGVHWSKAAAFISQIKKLPNLDIVGLFTHFATSDEKDKTFANLQLSRYQQVVTELQKLDISISLKHCANSGAILDMPNAYFDMVRPGIILYGYYPSMETTESIPLQPVMTFKTNVLYVKTIEPGDTVSYGRKFTADKPTRIATLPVGYADGYNRLLSNQASVLIQRQRFPVVGRVCMDLIHADLGANDSVEIGDEVVLFGGLNNAALSATELGDILQTIPYEVCCWVSARVPRVYIDN